MPKLVQADQMGFITGRQTFDATKQLLNIIIHVELGRTSSLLLSINAEKAFNRIHWGYIRQVLNRFGFQGRILSAVLALCSNPSTQVYTSSLLSKPFNITNGTCQGCPFTPLIFNLMIEPLAESIRSHPDIDGFHLAGWAHIVNLFADDMILMLTRPEVSLMLMIYYFNLTCSHIIRSISVSL